MSIPPPIDPVDVSGAGSRDDARAAVRRRSVSAFEERLRTVFRIMAITGFLVSLGLLVLCRDRYAAILGFSRVQPEIIHPLPGGADGGGLPVSIPVVPDAPEQVREQSVAPEPEPGREEPADIVPGSAIPVELRFLGVVVKGVDFVFVIDGSAAMGGPAGANTPFTHAKNEVMRSIAELTGGNRFQIIVSGEMPRTAPLSDGIGRLAVPTRANRRAAAEFLARSHPAGTTNARDALLDACRLEPTSILFITDALAPPLTRDDLSLLTRAARGRAGSFQAGIVVHTVEIGETIDPPTGSTFARLASSSGGQYYYLQAAAHQIEFSEQRIAVSPREDGLETASVPTPDAGKPASAGPDENRAEKMIPAIPAEPSEKEETDKTAQKSTSVRSESARPAAKPAPSPAKKYDLSRADQALIEDMAKSLYINAATSESLLKPRVLEETPEKVYASIPTVLKGAKVGFPPAEMMVGLFYMNAIKTPLDETKGFDCFLRSAQEDYPPAMTLVSDCFRLGRGIPVERAQAGEWCLKAAEKNEPVAMLKMATHFAGTPKEKFEWMSKAAEKGHPEAMYELALMYQRGTGTPKDLPESRRWMLRAAELGNAKARAKLK